MTATAGLDRRALLAVAALGVGASARAAPLVAGQESGATETFPIWPGAVPGSERVRVVEAEIPRSPTGPRDDTAFVHVTRPTLTMHRPAKPNGGALLLVPGGGYRRVAIGRDGRAIARRFADAGYCCFTLLYRLPGDGWAAGPDAPLQDAQRALRLIRAMAPRERFDPDKVAALGLSAGGHLAARLAAEPTLQTYSPVDAADALSARPKVAGLLYPVVLMAGATAHAGSRDELLGRSPMPESLARYAADRGVDHATPPTFLAAALDDPVVPVDNSLAMLSALRAAEVPAEMHLFETGGHGFGLTLADGSVSPWPDLFLRWASRHGMP